MAKDNRAYLNRRAEPDEPERHWSHVEELIELADGWECRHGADIREFLDHLVLSEVNESHATLSARSSDSRCTAPRGWNSTPA